MRVLVVEDEHKIANSIKKGLEQESYAVDVAYNGHDGYDLARGEEYDILILDILLPGIDGIEVCRKLRVDGIHTPIIMLTAKGQIEDKVTGLDSGADDYITKPFAFEELLARLRALKRRPTQTKNTVLQIDDLELNTTRFEVKRGNNKITLSNKEYALLEYFLRHPNIIITKEQIINHVWNYDANVLENSVEVYVKHLRDKIDKPFRDKPDLIHTVRGFGYKMSNRKG